MKRQDIAVLSCCGHVGHRACIEEAVLANQTCGYKVDAEAGKRGNIKKEDSDVNDCIWEVSLWSCWSPLGTILRAWANIFGLVPSEMTNT